MNGVYRWKPGIFLFLVWACFSWSGLSHAQNEKIFSPGELAKYNGQNGASAYVAVNGVVYDLTKVSVWAGGRHFCAKAAAGKDLTFLWNLAPPFHKSPRFLTRFPIVGKLTAVSQPSGAAPGRPSAASRNLVATLLSGFGIALAVTFGWLIFSLRKKKIK